MQEDVSSPEGSPEQAENKLPLPDAPQPSTGNGDETGEAEPDLKDVAEDSNGEGKPDA